MKFQIILLIALVSLFSCREDSNEFKNLVTQQDSNDNYNRLTGSWVMTAMQWEVTSDTTILTSSLDCYRCSEFTFQSNDEGFIKTGDGNIRQINWKGNKQSIQIVNVSSGNKADLELNSIFEEGSYKLIFKDDFHKVILIDSKGMKFNLSRKQKPLTTPIRQLNRE